eukprot:GFYU01011158.1.p1 GENE.GFYU01011158.1~~GFYU01011158.1.p1  ORF type:complete len:283 (+),score=54.80 GFYU01011158.1:75-923(+)
MSVSVSTFRQTAVSVMQKLAPLQLAGSWDNVGTLIEPPVVKANTDKPTIVLTTDLTEAVLDECKAIQPDVIVTYHPTLFSSLKRLTATDPIHRIAMGVVQMGALLYSPHTALDCFAGGINDWLANGLGKGKVEPIKADENIEGAGEGRVITFDSEMSLGDLVNNVKSSLSLDTVRVATPKFPITDETPNTRMVRKVAVCAGSGGSVVRGVKDADVWLTGEMSHHEVLAAIGNGVTVILSEHTLTETGYLPTLKTKLEASWPADQPKPDIHIAQRDTPLLHYQ